MRHAFRLSSFLIASGVLASDGPTSGLLARERASRRGVCAGLRASCSSSKHLMTLALVQIAMVLWGGVTTSPAFAAAPPTPPFTQCPPIGFDASCGTLLVVNADNTISVFSDPATGPYEGADDTLVGIQNDSLQPVPAIVVSSSVDIFAFDGDGLCTQSGAPVGCAFGPTAYEGPGTSFVLDPTTSTDGEVDFAGAGLTPGAHAYFSLETVATAATLTVRTGRLGGCTINCPINSFENFGGWNPSEPGLSGAQGCGCDPVNTATGNFSETFGDLGISGRGFPFGFSDTYNSQTAGTMGPLGFGWTFNYGMSLNPDATTGVVTIRQENGSQVTFTPNTSGGYSAPARVIATLTKNSDGSYAFVRRARETFTFSASGQLVKEQNLNGYTTTLTYDAAKQLVRVSDPAGRNLTIAYTQEGRISHVTDPIGRRVGFAYDAAGDLVDVTNVGGGHSRFTYDSNHLLLTITDPRGGTLTNHYARGQSPPVLPPGATSTTVVDRQTDALGRTTTLAYAPTSTTLSRPNGNETVEHYANGVRTDATAGSGTPGQATWHFAYDPATLEHTKVTDPNGHSVQTTFDSSGNPLTSVDALGRTTTLAYDALNDPTAITDPNGNTTTMTYDGHGNLLTMSRPLKETGQNQVATFHYDDPAHPGDVTSMTDPLGKTWRYTYDAAGNQTSATDPLGHTKTSSFNPIGWTLAAITRRGNRNAFTYNSFGDVTRQTDALGHATSFRYNANRLLDRLTDAKGRSTSLQYDAANELVTTTRADGTKLSNAYDANGNLSSQQNGLGHATKYEYDALDRLTAHVDPLGLRTTLAYDAASNVTARTQADGNVTSYSYDAANQLTGIGYSDGKTPNVSDITYDADGQRTAMTDGTGTSRLTYDSLNRLTSSTDGAGATVGVRVRPPR